MWKDLVSSHLSTLGMEGKGHLIKDAAFGETYMIYELSPDDIARYVASDSGDPSTFASVPTYTFPIYAGSVYLGGLRINNAKGPDDMRGVLEKGGYAVAGIDALNSTFPPRIAIVASAIQASGLRFVGFVGFPGFQMDRYFIVENETTRFFLPNEAVTASFLQNFDKDTLMLSARTEAGMSEMKSGLENKLRSRRRRKDMH